MEIIYDPDTRQFTWKVQGVQFIRNETPYSRSMIVPPDERTIILSDDMYKALVSMDTYPVCPVHRLQMVFYVIIDRWVCPKKECDIVAMTAKEYEEQHEGGDCETC